jgi:lipoprotein-anchoring transpeptidase ErfK/SrfK
MPVLPIRVRGYVVDRATGRMRALATDLAKPAGPPPPPPLVPAPGVKTIVLDKSDQTVTLYTADGQPLDRFPCASGVAYPRVGTYEVTSRKESSMYLGDRSTFKDFVIFTKADTGTNIGFHSIPHDGQGNDIGGLGVPESHGCVRLADEKAAFIYEWAPNGTKVVVQK